MNDLATIKTRLENIDQSHLLHFLGSLSHTEQTTLLDQIGSLDLESVPLWISTYVRAKPAASLQGKIEPAPYYPADPKSAPAWDLPRYRTVGEQLLTDGKVAAFTVAGGQGTRLGYDGPKGCYPATAISQKPLFQVFAEGLLAAERRYGKAVPWYIMTSPLNHAATVEFFHQHKFFGLSPANVRFFEQGVMPSFDLATGKILLANRGEVATNPDGHGGAVRALHVSGAIADMQKRGVAYVSYFQVDNPTVKVVDPVFLGLHAAAPDSSGEMSSKMVRKAGPDEKVGVFVSIDGHTQVVEYSDLPREYSQATLPDGSLKFPGGSIAIHIISVEFLERLATNPQFSLPFHRAEKKVPHIDVQSGAIINPAVPNGVKLERFIFDALPLCRQSLVMETERIEEFAPIKNASGVDSAESSKQLQSVKAAQWLETAGVTVPRKADGSPDCIIELSPLTALHPDDLVPLAPTIRITPGAQIKL